VSSVKKVDIKITNEYKTRTEVMLIHSNIAMKGIQNISW